MKRPLHVEFKRIPEEEKIFNHNFTELLNKTTFCLRNAETKKSGRKNRDLGIKIYKTLLER